jgi:hypothetical protein
MTNNAILFDISNISLFLLINGILFDVAHDSHFFRIIMQFEKGQEIIYQFYFYYYEKFFVNFGILIRGN